MKTILKFSGLAACLCMALSLTVRAEEGSSTNAPAKKHHRGPGGGEFGGANAEEMQKFREKLKDMTPEQRQEAIKKFREKMGARAGGGEFGGPNREEMEKLRERMKDMTPEQRQEAMKKMAEKMKERIEQNDKLTAEQKKEILAHMAKMNAEREKIMNDSSLNEEQKREALQKLREKARDMFQKHREALEGQHPRKEGTGKGGGKPNPEQKQAIEAKPSV